MGTREVDVGAFDHFDPDDNVTSFEDAIKKGYGIDPKTGSLGKSDKQRRSEGNLNAKLLPHFPEIVQELFGSPVHRYTNDQHLETWYWGTNRSLRAIISDGRWYDQEAKAGGYIFGLIMHAHPDKSAFAQGCSKEEAFTWLEDNEYLDKSNVTGISYEFIYQTADRQNWVKVIRTEYPNTRRQKTFSQFHWDGEKWLKGLDVWVSSLHQNVKRQHVLYRLPELNEAIASGQRIFIVEGEKKAEAAVALGVVATTAPEGAGKWTTNHTHYSTLLTDAR
jgi:hypothetical protein